ncbi:hypothetical protein GC177_08505 [bacterium]|nr:hypothetical protein [bacterium]
MRGHLLACALCLVLVACMDRPQKYKYHPPQYVPAQQYNNATVRDNDTEYMLLMDPTNDQSNRYYY